MTQEPDYIAIRTPVDRAEGLERAVKFDTAAPDVRPPLADYRFKFREPGNKRGALAGIVIIGR